MKFLVAFLLVLSTGACVTYDERDSGYRGHSQSGPAGPDTVVVCHKGKKTMSLPSSALNGHLGHGDHRGPC